MPLLFENSQEGRLRKSIAEILQHYLQNRVMAYSLKPPESVFSLLCSLYGTTLDIAVDVCSYATVWNW